MLELALVFEPYFVDDEFYQPTMDFQNNELFIVLDSQVNDKIFNTFMTTWLRGQAVDKEFIDGANEYEEIPFFGGLQLTMGDKTIRPSCCASLNDIREWARIYQGEKIGIWLGHDPEPYISYDENDIIVTSDIDYGDNSDKIFDLRFSQQEFKKAFEKIIGDIEAIKEFSQKWARDYLPQEFQQAFIEVFDKCFDLNLSKSE